ncbi:U20-hexatoxin-Hi1a-like [Brevipalpus obovatus]|uniref:U20-hexatoxin-Hi1a-like n=1 Tax=Brevipalpus obovatus TaxID=246614 RepID=UPI003D9E7BBB
MNIKLILCIFATLLAVALASPAANDKQTACQRHRQRESSSSTPNLPGKVIPNCDASGDYAPLQCHGETTKKGVKFCQCWTKSGDIISQPSTKIKTCSCLLDKDEKTKKKATEIPACEASGHYKKAQCNATSCRCVNPDTGATVKSNIAKDKAETMCV